MKFGVVLPHLGAEASPSVVIEVARRAEELRYDSLWVIERLLYPTNPRSAYPASPDGTLPKLYARALSPLETLSYVAAHTSEIALGTSVLVMPLHNPVMLARQLATIDVFSGGRLRVGLGQGWSVDEMEAAGTSPKERAARADEFIQVLKTIWTSDPAEFNGAHFTLPRSILQPKPTQAPHPPIYLAAYAPGALKRVGQMANGWMPAGVPLAAMRPMMEQARGAASAAGRDPHALELIIVAFASILEESPGADRADFVGTLEEIRRDVATARDLGATEIIFDIGYSGGDLDVGELMRSLEPLATLA